MRVSKDVLCNEEMLQLFLNANTNLATLVVGLHNDALKSWDTLYAMFCSLSSQLQKLIL